jgi:hypothetical protein
MSWAKRNLYFLISCIAAVVLLGAAGWYSWSSHQDYTANTEKLKSDYAQMKQFADKNPGPGNDQVDNIKTAKEQTEQAKQRVAELEKFFTPVKSIPDTNKFNDRMLAFAVRETVSQLRAAAQAKAVTLPTTMGPEFAFSFSLQMGKSGYDPNSAEMLARQLGEVKTICDTLFGARILSLDSIQRERTSDDINPQGNMTLQPDYTDSISLTNKNMVITPYQVTFQCFTPQLGSVLSGFANQSHTIVVKTVNIQPVDLAGGMGGYGNAGYGNAGYGNPGYGNAGGYNPVPNPQATPLRPGVLPTIIDEKKLKVVMLVDFVKIPPAQGK